MRKIALGLIGFVGLVAVTAAPPSLAQEKHVPDDWQFKLTPYAWALALDGDVTVKGQKSSPSVSFSEIFDDLNYAVMLEGDLNKGRLGAFANLLYADLGVTEKPGGPLRIRLKTTVDVMWLAFGAYYRLGPWKLNSDKGDAGPKVVLDPYLGGRYTYLDAKIKVRDGGRQVDDEQDWVEPIVGMRTLWELTPNWSVIALGDIGGFGAGSDFAWQATGLVGHSFGLFGENDARFDVGYRALSQDYDTGSGSNEFEWDMTLHGPIMALAIHF